MPDRLRVLLVEDIATDAELIAHALKRDGFDAVFERVDTEAALTARVASFAPQVVLSDFSLPGFSGMAALELVHGLSPETPFIFVSGTIGEERAIESLKCGASDYVLKTNLARLGSAVRQALERTAERAARARAEAELAEAHQRQRMLSRRLIRAQERERADLARELHDEVGQAFTALKIQLEMLRRAKDADETAVRIDECAEIVGSALTQVRNLSLGLRPPQLDEFGLVSALRSHVERMARTATTDIGFEADPQIGRLHPDVEIACFRIAQESLTNALRHAQADRIRVLLRINADTLMLVVQDNGRGFDVRAASEQALRGTSMGVAGLHERALLAGGIVRIESEPGRGTEVVARFTLKPQGRGPSGGG